MVFFILSKEIKIFIALVIVCTISYLIYNKNWYQALIVLNISIHYKNFIEFFMDLDDELIMKNHEDDKFTHVCGKNNFKKYYFVNNDNKHYYTNFKENFNSDVSGIKKMLDENLNNSNNMKLNNSFDEYIEKSKSLTDEENDNTKHIEHSINNITDVINENHGYNIFDLGHFSNQIYDRNKKINIRAAKEFPTDDIKLATHVELNNYIPWWELSDLK